jgi:type I restriction enzyme S subunit
MKNKIQSGWRTVKLGEVCVSKTGTRSPADEPNSIFNYVDITSVDNVSKRIVASKELLGCNAPSRARQIIRAGDVLVSTTRPNLNAVALVPPELDNQIASTGFCVLRGSDEIDSEFLFSFVRTPEFVSSLTELTKGALYPAVNDKQVFSQSISLPPKDEQRRIAERLREQMAAVERARAAVQAQLDAAQTLVLALLRESLKAAGRRKWHIPECLSEITQGIGERWSEFPVLGATRAGLAPAKEGVGKNPGRYKPVTPGTVFYNPMRILLGSIALLSDDDQPGITSPDYVVIRGIEGRLHSTWFYYWFRSPAGADFIQSLTRGAVRERLLFNRLAKGEIEIPNWQTQLHVVEQLQEIKKLRHSLATRLAEIQLLPATLLRSAFNGN